MAILHIYSGTNHIGDASLESLDAGMGVAHGSFHPSPGYQRVRASVQAAAEARDRGHHANVKGLSARAPNGEVIASGFIQIDDFADATVDPEISIQFVREHTAISSTPRALKNWIEDRQAKGRVEVRVDPRILDSYAGQYQFETLGNRIYTFVRAGEKLSTRRRS
jgi:hypothetical protein